MNVVYIILGVILIVILYVGYVYYAKSATTLATIINCSSASTYVDGANLSNPTSSNFGYGLWIYVKDWATSTTTGITNIFYRTGTTSSTSGHTIHVFMDNTSPSLYVQFSDPTTGANYTKTSSGTDPAILVTSNIPLQKWIYLFVSVDGGTYVDIYLDGKMVKTAILTNSVSGEGASTSTGKIPGVVVGPFNGYVTTFQSFGYAVDPQTVWSYYMKGNGNALGTTYGLNFSITKNDTAYGTYRVF
jgi:hypothetical protein